MLNSNENNLKHVFSNTNYKTYMNNLCKRVDYSKDYLNSKPKPSYTRKNSIF